MAFVDLPTHSPAWVFVLSQVLRASACSEGKLCGSLGASISAANQPLKKRRDGKPKLAVADLAEGAGEVGPPDAVITGGPVPNSSKLLARKGGFADRLEPADGHYQAHGPLQGKPLLNLTDKGYHKSLFSLSFPLFHS